MKSQDFPGPVRTLRGRQQEIRTEFEIYKKRNDEFFDASNCKRDDCLLCFNKMGTGSRFGGLTENVIERTHKLYKVSDNKTMFERMVVLRLLSMSFKFAFSQFMVLSLHLWGVCLLGYTRYDSPNFLNGIVMFISLLSNKWHSKQLQHTHSY